MEAKFTRCPHCKTVFRLLPHQLAAAQGRVRCGACLQVFPADHHFVRPVTKNASVSAAIAPEKNVPTASIAPPVAPVSETPKIDATPVADAATISAVAIATAPEFDHENIDHNDDDVVSTTSSTPSPPIAMPPFTDEPDPWSDFGFNPAPSPIEAPPVVTTDETALATASEPPVPEHDGARDNAFFSDDFGADNGDDDALSWATPDANTETKAKAEAETCAEAEAVPMAAYDNGPSDEVQAHFNAMRADDGDLRFDDDNGLSVDDDPRDEPVYDEPTAATAPLPADDPDDDFMKFEIRDDVPADTSNLPPDWFKGSPREEELAAFTPVEKPGGDFGERDEIWQTNTTVQAFPGAAETATPRAKPVVNKGHWQGEHVYGLQNDALTLADNEASENWRPETAVGRSTGTFELPPTGPKFPWKGLGFSAAAALLMVLLVTQILWPKRVEWREDEEWGGYVESVCQHIDCELPPRRNVKKIALVQKASVVKDARDPKKLKIDLLMKNSASFDQAFPDIELTFTDIDGQTVATRRFQPSEYLGKDEPPTIMPMAVPVHVSFVVMEPKPTVTGFEFAFLPASEPLSH